MTAIAKKENLSRSQLRRIREKEQRFLTILKSAEKLFARKGYHQTSMEQVADLAEVSVGTVYFYFKNKEDLLINLMEDVGFHLREFLGNAFRQADASLEGIRNAGLAFFNDFCRQYPERVSIFFREAAGQSNLVEAQRKKLFGKLTQDLQEALNKISKRSGVHFPSESSAELMAVCIVGIYERVACHYLLWQGRPKDMLTISNDAVNFTLGGVTSLMKEK